MISVNKKVIVLNMEDNAIEYENLKIIKEDSDLLNAKKSVKTRICKNYDSIYINAPSREIKKWFEFHKI